MNLDELLVSKTKHLIARYRAENKEIRRLGNDQFDEDLDGLWLDNLLKIAALEDSLKRFVKNPNFEHKSYILLCRICGLEDCIHR